jgi:hypothetical protein
MLPPASRLPVAVIALERLFVVAPVKTFPVVNFGTLPVSIAVAPAFFGPTARPKAIPFIHERAAPASVPVRSSSRT